MNRSVTWGVIAALAVGAVGANAVVLLQTREYKSGIVWPEPKVVDPGPVGGPPSDAVVLFGGKDLAKWKNGENWEIAGGVATARKTGIETLDKFGDCQFHIEFATPEKVSGSGQGRGNSGVYFMGKYEVQILDSFNNPTYFDGQAAAIYKQSPPMVNASRKPGEWQTYDIAFEAPLFGDDGQVTRPAILTVFHNGVLTQDHDRLTGGSGHYRQPPYQAHPEKLPLVLQNHKDPGPVQFRNIWYRPLPDLGERNNKIDWEPAGGSTGAAGGSGGDKPAAK